MTAGDYYKLVNRIVVPCSLEEWAAFFGDREARTVGRTSIGQYPVEYRVITLCEGLDPYAGPDVAMCALRLFAGALFKGPLGEGRMLDECRYTTWREAEVGHAKMVAVAMAMVAEGR